MGRYDAYMDRIESLEVELDEAEKHGDTKKVHELEIEIRKMEEKIARV